MQNDNEDDLNKAIEDCVAQHTQSEGTVLFGYFGEDPYAYRLKPGSTDGGEGPRAVLRNMFEDVLRRGIVIGRRKAIDEIAKASAAAVTQARADFQAAVNDREEKRRDLSFAESEVRVQEAMVENAKKAGAAIGEILKTIESK